MILSNLFYLLVQVIDPEKNPPTFISTLKLITVILRLCPSIWKLWISDYNLHYFQLIFTYCEVCKFYINLLYRTHISQCKYGSRRPTFGNEFFYHVGSDERTQLLRPCTLCLFYLSHLEAESSLKFWITYIKIECACSK